MSYSEIALELTKLIAPASCTAVENLTPEERAKRVVTLYHTVLDVLIEAEKNRPEANATMVKGQVF